MAIERHRVTMVNFSALPDGGFQRIEANDFVAVEHIDEYVADAKTRWALVEVSEEIDHGPGGAEADYTHHLG